MRRQPVHVGLTWLFACGLLNVGSAVAQDEASQIDDGWQFSAAVYLWAADVGGRTTTGSSVEVDFSDIVDNLDSAFDFLIEGSAGCFRPLIFAMGFA